VDQFAPVLLVHLLDLLAHPPLHLLEPRLQPIDLILEPEHGLDAGEVEPELGSQLLDQPQPLEVDVRVETRVAARPLRAHESLLLVHPQRLRVHADELGGDGDHVPGPVVHYVRSPPARVVLAGRETPVSQGRRERS
jgi:hypothetical protein